MNKYCNIKPDLYPYNVIVSIDQTTEELHIKVKKYFISFESFKSLLGEFKNRSGDCTFSSEGKVAIIRLTAQKDKIDTLSILNHELLHATFFILDDLGIKFNIDSSDEAYTYLFGFLFTKSYKQLKKYIG